MIYKIKLSISLLFIFLILSCDGNYDKKFLNSNFYYKIYHYHRKYYEDDYILRIPKELPIKIENIDSVFIFNCDNFKDIHIEIERSNLKRGSCVIRQEKGNDFKFPMCLDGELVVNKHQLFSNSVFFRTISKNPYSVWYDEDDILLISYTLYDNYEINYIIKNYIKIPFDHLKNIYKYAKLMKEIEIFKVEN